MRYFLNVSRTGFVYIGLRFYTAWVESSRSDWPRGAGSCVKLYYCGLRTWRASMTVCVKHNSHTSALESARLIGGLVSNFIVRPQVKAVIGIMALLAAVADCISSSRMVGLYFVAGDVAGYFLTTL